MLVVISSGIISCQKDDNIYESHFISASINDTNWSGTPDININKYNDSLTILGYGNEQHVVIKIKFKGEGSYDLENSKTIYFTTVGGDVITNFYTLDLNYSSQLKVTEYNPEQNILKGKFEFSLIKERNNPRDTMDIKIFKNGKFKGSINEWSSR